MSGRKREREEGEGVSWREKGRGREERVAQGMGGRGQGGRRRGKEREGEGVSWREKGRGGVRAQGMGEGAKGVWKRVCWEQKCVWRRAPLPPLNLFTHAGPSEWALLTRALWSGVVCVECNPGMWPSVGWASDQTDCPAQPQPLQSYRTPLLCQ